MGKSRTAKPQSEEACKPWTITQADIDATTDLEAAFATTRCLPQAEEIPDEFWGCHRNLPGNIYYHMVDAMFCGAELPEGNVAFNEGFREDGPATFKFLMAHLRSFEPQYEHKIAAVAFMVSKIMTVTPVKETK
jgi:hypothetical protein